MEIVKENNMPKKKLSPGDWIPLPKQPKPGTPYPEKGKQPTGKKGPNVVRKVATRVISRGLMSGGKKQNPQKALRASTKNARANIAKIAAKKGRALTKVEKQGVTQRSTRRTAARHNIVTPKKKKKQG